MYVSHVSKMLPEFQHLIVAPSGILLPLYVFIFFRVPRFSVYPFQKDGRRGFVTTHFAFSNSCSRIILFIGLVVPSAGPIYSAIAFKFLPRVANFRTFRFSCRSMRIEYLFTFAYFLHILKLI